MSDLLDYLAFRPHTILVAVNAEKIANSDRNIRNISQRHTAYADGMGAVLALKRHGLTSARLAGADLWLQLISRFHEQPIYLIGGSRDVVKATVEKLAKLFPGINLVGWRDGFMSADDELELISHLRHTRPRLVFVAMGSPRQERLMEKLFSCHPATYMGLGGAFDVLVGKKRRAPVWVQRIGLEWLFRFFVERGRIRRLPTYLRFLGMLATRRV